MTDYAIRLTENVKGLTANVTSKMAPLPTRY